jgi:hypothetical protein
MNAASKFTTKENKKMTQRNLFLAIVLMGTCVGVAPAWSQTSLQTKPGDTPVADKAGV